MIIDCKRAFERILYEKYYNIVDTASYIQKLLFPKRIELQADEALLLKEIMQDINILGFDINELGQNTFVINGYPQDITEDELENTLELLLETAKNCKLDAKDKLKEKLAITLSKKSSSTDIGVLNPIEMNSIFTSLFACKNHNFTPDGKKIIAIINDNDIIKLLPPGISFILLYLLVIKSGTSFILYIIPKNSGRIINMVIL